MASSTLHSQHHLLGSLSLQGGGGGGGEGGGEGGRGGVGREGGGGEEEEEEEEEEDEVEEEEQKEVKQKRDLILERCKAPGSRFARPQYTAHSTPPTVLCSRSIDQLHAVLYRTTSLSWLHLHVEY